MNLSTDHHFSIGDQHLRQGKPCQDYATSGIFENYAYAIVSDGCSSGGETDIGSRLTALSTAVAIKNHQDINIIQSQMYRALELKREDMLATCLYASISEDGGFIHVLGDGIIAWKEKNGSVAMKKLDWAGNAPLYPIYKEDNFSSFMRFHDGEDVFAFTAEKWLYEPEKGYEFVGKTAFTVADGIKGYSEFFSKERILNENIEFIAVFSDGVTQIENMDWKDTVTELLAYKSIAGAFVKRRVISFLKNGALTGKKPIDDLACASIHIDLEGGG